MSAESATAPAKTQPRSSSRDDTQLIRECLSGSEAAWSALIDKYKNLIFSIPLKYGFCTDDATDIFQAVCLEMLSELPKLRKPKALPKWLMQVTAHKCFHHKQQLLRMAPAGADNRLPERGAPAIAEQILREAENEQKFRQALSELPPRCRNLIHMLFVEEPARPYRAIAAELGLATGSIGFIRQRCLDRLRSSLERVGF